jgi:cell division protein FtsB
MAGGPQILARKLALALVFPALGYALYATGQQAVESRRMAQQVAELQQTVDGLAVENIRLQNELMYRRSDEYVERVAREELGLVMPGDTAAGGAANSAGGLAEPVLRRELTAGV